MPAYKAPLRDMNFVIHELLEAEKIFQTLPSYEEATEDLIGAIIEEGAKFAEEVLSPLNQSGDEEGCSWSEGEVTTPQGFADAYRQYVENGWPSLSANVESGGQGMPNLLSSVINEMAGTANWSWLMYPGLSLGAVNTVEAHGDAEQKDSYLKKLVTGEWTGTMCLTEAQCGSDLGLLRTKAEPQADGTYAVTGTKIFISAGEHDMAENIVHIVLARLPDAPAGTKGISLFIVPKFKVNEDGSLGEHNNVHCASIEKKMGIKASATCVMNFDGATGYLIGPPNKGLSCMFTFMNTARIGTAIQGIAAAELAFQNSLAYAKERRSMHPLSGPKSAEHVADTIINHPDVRRMLLKQKAIAEGGRAMLYDAAMLADRTAYAIDEKELSEIDDKLGFLTPILKGFFTELGIEAANDGMQVFGGHGYIKEWGMEQIARDVRISSLYEGTTGIQGLDLLGRKVILDGFKQFRAYNKRIRSFYTRYIFSSAYRWKMLRFIWPLIAYQLRWYIVLLTILLKARKNRDAVGVSTYDFLMYSGFMTTAFYWAMMAHKAMEKLDKGGDEPAEYYRAKIETATFYFERMLPRAKAHAAIISGSLESVVALDEADFSFE